MRHIRTRVAALVAAAVLGTAACSSGASVAPTTGPASAQTTGPASAQPASPQATAGAEAVELRMMWWGSDSRHQATLAALALYQNKHPNVKITSEYMAGDAYFPKLATLVAGGDTPDIAQMNYSYFGTYLKDGVWLALDKYIPDPLNMDTFDASVRAQSKENGVTYAVPAGVNTETIVYDPALFAAGNVPEPSWTWTWDEYKQICEKLVASKVVKYCSNDFSISDQIFDTWLVQRGKQWYTSGGQLGFTAADLAEFWTYFAGLRGRGLLPAASLSAEQLGGGDVTTSQLVKGNSAMEMAWTSQITGQWKATGKSLKVVPMPAGPGPGQFLGGRGLMWCASSKTKHPEVVADVLNFLMNDPEAIAKLRLERAVPPTEQARTALVGMALTDAEKQTVEVTQKIAAGPLATEDVYFQNPPPAVAEVTKLFRTYAEYVTFEKQTVDAAAAGFVKEASALLGK